MSSCYVDGWVFGRLDEQMAVNVKVLSGGWIDERLSERVSVFIG